MSTDYVYSTRGTDSRFSDDARLLSPLIEDYAHTAQSSIDKISRLWNEIELPKDDRQNELDDISEAVKSIWTSAVERAEKKREEAQQKIDKAVQDIYKIKEDLGEAPRESQHQGIEGLLRLEQIVGRSLHARHRALQELLEQWRQQRSQREEDFKALQSQINRLKIRFGDVVIAASLSPRKSDISLGNLQKLTEELEECKTEKLKRERELAALLSKLRSVCLQLGENDIDVAAKAHPSLRFYREALPDQFSHVRPSFSNQPGLQRNIRPDDIELDLSDETFANLEGRIVEVFDLKANREKQTAEVADILRSLWKALDIPEDDLERGIHIRALEGPTRLHSQSIEKCRNEVRRLEKAKAKQLWELIDLKRGELEQLCVETKLPTPRLCPLLTITNDDDEGSSVGNISDALSKLSKMITETRTLAEKREPILTQINELEHSRSEVNWLSEYEQDGDRYKGRDSTKKLNRALRAGRMRDKLPDMIKNLRKAIMQWEQEERCPFVYDSQDYNVVLENMQLEITVTRQPAVRNPRRTNARGGRAPSRTAYTPPPPHAISPTPSNLDHHDELHFGPSNLPQVPGAGTQGSTQNHQGGMSLGTRTAAGNPTKHYPDNAQNSEPCTMPRQRSMRGTSRDPARTARDSNSRRSDDSQSTTPSVFGLLASPTLPHALKSPADASSYNILYRTSPATEKGTPVISRQCDTNQGNGSSQWNDHTNDSELHNVDCMTQPRMSRGISPRNTSRHGRASDSTSSYRGTRSTGSSRRSLALEKTEGKPC